MATKESERPKGWSYAKEPSTGHLTNAQIAARKIQSKKNMEEYKKKEGAKSNRKNKPPKPKRKPHSPPPPGELSPVKGSKAWKRLAPPGMVGGRTRRRKRIKKRRTRRRKRTKKRRMKRRRRTRRRR